MKILGLIPARGGSKGVIGKNKKLLNGKPLIQYSIDVAQKSKYLSKVIVSSDDLEILEISKKLGLETPFVRPEILATDTSTTLSVVQHAIRFFEDNGSQFDAVCLLQPTSPFRNVEFLDKALQKFMQSDLDSLLSVLEVPHEYNPHWIFEENLDGSLKISTGEKEIISRRQDLPRAFHRDGSIYITKRDVIMNQNSLYGAKIGYIVSDKNFHVNIDTPDDWLEAERLAKLL